MLFRLIPILIVLIVSCATYKPLQVQGCHVIDTPAGPEEIELDQQTRRIFFSAQERRRMDPEGEWMEQGSIYELLADKENVRPLPLVNRDEFPFHPGGMVILQKDSRSYLYVINQALLELPSIEIFEIRPQELFFLRRFRSPVMYFPQDMIFAGNDLYIIQSPTERTMDFYLPGRPVLRLRDGRWTQLNVRTRNARGITSSEDGRSIYISEQGGKVKIFSRELDGNLTYKNSMQFPGEADGISRYKDWIKLTVHRMPSLYRNHIKRPVASPGTIWRFHYFLQTPQRYMDYDGKDISGVSSVLTEGNKMFLGQRYGRGIMICPEN
jgi:hypothetical protein